MRINVQMLAEGLQESDDVTVSGKISPETNLRFPCFYEGGTGQLHPGGVYLAPPSQIPRENINVSVVWITWGTSPVRPGDAVISFRSETDPYRILNKVQSVFARFQLWNERISQVPLGLDGVKELIYASDSMFHHPVCVVDSSMNCLACNSAFLSPGHTALFPSDGDQKPADGAALFYDPLRDRAKSLIKQGVNMGILYMLENGLPFSVTEEVLFEQLAEHISKNLESMTVLSGLYENSFKQQMIHYFATKHGEETNLYEALSQWGGRQGDIFLCCKIRASHLNQEVNAQYISSIFENVLRAAIAFWHDGVLVLLVDVTHSGCDEEAIRSRLVHLLVQLHCKAGVSLPFTDLLCAWYYFRQACCAFETGYPADREKELYDFNDYAGSYMISHSQGEFPVPYLLDGGMRRLQEHDRKYSVSYFDTLRAYFDSEMNISRTADLLGIHRTSLNTRMQKIREILNHEWTPDYLLYLQLILTNLRTSKDSAE